MLEIVPKLRRGFVSYQFRFKGDLLATAQKLMPNQAHELGGNYWVYFNKGPRGGITVDSLEQAKALVSQRFDLEKNS